LITTGGAGLAGAGVVLGGPTGLAGEGAAAAVTGLTGAAAGFAGAPTILGNDGAALGADGAAWGLLGPVGLVGAVVVAGAAGLAGAVTGALADGAAGAGVTAFLTERMAFDGAGVAGVGVAPAGLAGATGREALLPLGLIKSRMRPASSSLIELLWLLAAIDSFSAASSTSRLSRPKSRDSS